jgi:hypothetical protein
LPHTAFAFQRTPPPSTHDAVWVTVAEADDGAPSVTAVESSAANPSATIFRGRILLCGLARSGLALGDLVRNGAAADATDVFRSMSDFLGGSD